MTVPNVAPGGEIEADWGNAVANEVNGVTATAAGKVSKAGDRLTGNLWFEGNNPAIVFEGGGITRIAFADYPYGPTRLMIERNATTGQLSISQYNAAGAWERYVLVVNGDGTAGILTTNLVIPATINHPDSAVRKDYLDAQLANIVTASDPTTGRLAIGGHEIGDTGLRNITNLLAAGWDTGYGQQVTLRRSGNVVYLGGDMNTGLTPPNSFLTIPYGFWPMAVPSSFEVGFLLKSEMNEERAQWFRIVHYTGEVIPVWQPMAPQTPYCRFHVTYMTNQPWPTSLPGVAPATAMMPEDESEDSE